MNKSFSLIITSIAAIMLASCQTTKDSSSTDRFAEADSNHDGKLDRDETSDYYVTSVFSGRDANHDGKLTWEEWHVPGVKENKAHFAAADTDKDGSLSMEEARAYGRKRGVFADSFRKADVNHDGYVTRDEARNLYASTEGPPR
jgi:Ca2+-binding EF-hand superfamily protein